MEELQSQNSALDGEQSVKEEEVEKENLTDMTAPDDDEEDEEALPHSEILDIFEEGLAQLVQDPLLCDLPIQVTLEEVNSQIALEYGQAMTVRVLKADGEIMPIVVVQNATVLDLKKAIRRFMELKQQREGGVKHVSWRYVWRTFHLVFQGEKLEDDRMRLREIHLEQRRKLAATMTSSDSEQSDLSTELKHVSLKMQQLLERKKILCVFKELRSRVEFGQTEEAFSNQSEIDSIDVTLKELSDKKAELQTTYDDILNAKEMTSRKKVSVSSDQKTEPIIDVAGPHVVYIEAPPTFTAPTVIMDLENLPPHPCRTQCPECRQFIMTETSTSVTSLTWLACLMTALIGCFAGCCLIPFCIDTFKSITHKCPKCRSSIRTLKKL